MCENHTVGYKYQGFGPPGLWRPKNILFILNRALPIKICHLIIYLQHFCYVRLWCMVEGLFKTFSPIIENMIKMEISSTK